MVKCFRFRFRLLRVLRLLSILLVLERKLEDVVKIVRIFVVSDGRGEEWDDNDLWGVVICGVDVDVEVNVVSADFDFHEL